MRIALDFEHVKQKAIGKECPSLMYKVTQD